jgi:gliding motility-associated-like protein
VFTPNGDSVNDYFSPVSLNINNYNILIYNRWGGLVYENNTLESNWNGTYKGEPCAIGVYFYVLNATSYSGREYNLNGTVTLLR